MKSLDFKEFVKVIHADFHDTPVEQIEQLLNIGEAFTKDSPVSTGKRLTITSVAFQGEKISEEANDYAGDIINYSKAIDSGINIWIADNLKGKSSIFKILKYGLTGANSLKTNIKKWIKLILINFKINEKEYSIFLDCSKRSLKGILYSCHVLSIEQVENFSEQILFESSGETEYQNKIQDFFFKQFTYYSLRWTQKTSQKDKNELLEVGTSWKTYFKSIFLESSDSAIMFGDQGKKIFQMLLGLEFTYAINYFSVEKDKLVFERAKKNSLLKELESSHSEKIEQLNNQLKEIDDKLAAGSQQATSKLDLTEYYKERENLLNSLKENGEKISAAQQKIDSEKSALDAIKEKRKQHSEAKVHLDREIRKVNKQISDLEEYVEIGIYFANLDISKCPSCNHSISEHQKQNALRAKTCSVCHDDIEPEQDIDEKEIYEGKIRNLKITLSGLQIDLEKLKNREEKDDYDMHYANIIKFGQELDHLLGMTDISERLETLNEILSQQTLVNDPIDVNREELIAERAVINFQLQEKHPTLAQEENDYDLKIKVYEKAITELGTQRFKHSENVLNRLSALMLNEIHQMGMKSISEIIITANFDIKYKQDGDHIGFEEIAEGEQLRAKLALYLSLIQLDIEYNFGRHTKFLIIDSPAKEEADANYMSGLSNLLATIHERFGTKLQILVGSAERSLIDAVPNQHVTPEDQFVF
ncbi:hypothetical protein EG359_06205 [Chryseobacterium joostei]|uniref:Rad50/SbcC-type AAA domain-containing protein n=1 Tax=Chryseobacterium joostei TaxID=112234 RepID=A0A1N7HSU6_9FLAO|nr:hypothetical protein [Chryseobacterium joostei]AZA99222.1 hypothetical protein EG359_06205 [Chryseobacterium joostei]SIS27912.1 hypothetical protein SAMN05421768_101116 [Chryseobacterium joostei]